jgi:REP element-mobilizing transposase RayT
MSAPRQITPGTVFLLTRRCAQRQLFLRPGPQINQIFLFCLAHAAQRFRIQIHNFCVLSNHFHIVVTDVHGTLPQFMHWLDEYVAKCCNAHLGRWETFWAPGSYSAVRLLDHDDIVEKMVYVYTNPVDAGLVATAREWPGARSLPEDIAGPAAEIKRPQGFFRENGPVPERTLLHLSVPDALGEATDDPVGLLERAVHDREQEIQRRFQAEGRRCHGRRRVLAQTPFGRPKSATPRRSLNPGIASRDKWRRIETLRRLKEFLDEYRRARLRYLEGDRSVLFPWGTYWMRVRLGVMCAGP